MDESYYQFEKAEFQDEYAHAQHVLNCIIGADDTQTESYAEVYQKEAQKITCNPHAMIELVEVVQKWIKKGKENAS